MIVRDACPACGSTGFKKNGHIHSGKQNHQCKACGRQFVADATDRIISHEQRTLIEHLLRERISLFWRRQTRPLRWTCTTAQGSKRGAADNVQPVLWLGNNSISERQLKHMVMMFAS